VWIDFAAFFHRRAIWLCRDVRRQAPVVFFTLLTGASSGAVTSVATGIEPATAAVPRSLLQTQIEPAAAAVRTLLILASVWEWSIS
jgi:hypothetical protein